MQQSLKYNVQRTQVLEYSPTILFVDSWQAAPSTNGVQMVQVNTRLIEVLEDGNIIRTKWSLLPKAVFESCLVEYDKISGVPITDPVQFNVILSQFNLEMAP